MVLQISTSFAPVPVCPPRKGDALISPTITGLVQVLIDEDAIQLISLIEEILTELQYATKNKQAREQIYEIVGPVLLIFVSPSITGVRTTDKMYQTEAFFSFDEIKFKGRAITKFANLTRKKPINR